MKKIAIIFAIALGFSMVSCKKSQLKKPTAVSTKMDINRLPNVENSLVFNSGYIWIASFSVEGTRQEGGPVELSRSFSSGLQIQFDPNNAISDLYMDIPQGNYTDLDIEFDTYDGTGIPIQVEGIYTNQSSQSFPIIFEFESSETFSINGESDNGDPIIILDKDVPMTAFVKLDPIYWFDIVSTNQWNNANLSDVGGTMTIVINDESNENIYDIVADRVDESTEAKFED